MIVGANPSNKSFSENESPGELAFQKSAGTIDEVIRNIEKRRQNVLNGGVNCIPFPFERFRRDVPGIEKEQYVIVTANQKTGKTQLADFLYVFHALNYAFENPDKCSVHIIYFTLEESVQKVLERYMSYLLYKLDGLRFSPQDLRSTSVDYLLPEEVIGKLLSEPYQERLRFFDKCVQFETEETNPTGMLRVCERYAKSVGEYKSHKQESRGNAFKEVEVFDSYKQYDDRHYVIVITDHVGLVDKEQGMKTKDSIDKWSEYCLKYLRNRYGFTVVNIQQQASESEGLEAIKAKRMTPSTATLGDSKYTGRDCNIMLGLFDPHRFGLREYLGYLINAEDGTGLKNCSRFLSVLVNRDGEMNGVCPLFFDGAVCHFEELPKPDEVNAISAYYNRVQNMRSYRQKKKLSTLTMLTFLKSILHNK